MADHGTTGKTSGLTQSMPFGVSGQTGKTVASITSIIAVVPPQPMQSVSVTYEKTDLLEARTTPTLQYSVAFTTKVSGGLQATRVRIYDRESGIAVLDTMSQASGLIEVPLLDPDKKYYAVSLDPAANKQAGFLDLITPS